MKRNEKIYIYWWHSFIGGTNSKKVRCVLEKWKIAKMKKILDTISNFGDMNE